MSRPKLIKKLQQKNPKLNISEIVKIVDCFSDSIQYALINGRKVELRGFGAFSLKKREARVGRNPKSGEAVNVPEKVAIFYKPGKDLKNRMNNNG